MEEKRIMGTNHGDNMKFTVGMATHNQLAMTMAAVDIILKHSNGEGEFILYDDCSTDGTREYFDSHIEQLNKLGKLQFKFIKGETPHMMGSFGQLFKTASPDSEMYVKLDSDVVYLPPRWMNWVEEKFSCFPDMGVMILLDYGYYQYFQRHHKLPYWDEPLDLDSPTLPGCFGHGFFMAFTAVSYRLANGFPESPGWHHHDCILEERITRGQHKKFYAFKELPVIHLGTPHRKKFYEYNDGIISGH